MVIARPQVQPIERIHSPNLRVLASHNPGLPFREAWLRAKEEGLTIASNARLDEALFTDEYVELQRQGLWPAWAGEITVHRKMRFRLGNEIVYTDPDTNERWIFQVPAQYTDEWDVLFVLSPQNYTLSFDGRDITVQYSSPDVVDALPFPMQFGHFLSDSKYRLPTGNETVETHPDSRGLWRADQDWVGPIVRGFLVDCVGRPLVVIGRAPSESYGIAVEEPVVVQERLSVLQIVLAIIRRLPSIP